MCGPKSEELEELIEGLNCLDLGEHDAQALDRMLVLLESPQLAEEWANDPAIPEFLENMRRPHDPSEPRCLLLGFTDDSDCEHERQQCSCHLWSQTDNSVPAP